MNFDIRKTQKQIVSQEKLLNTQKIKVRCACPHKRDGEITVTNVDGKFICYQCQKELVLSKKDVNDLKKALSEVDSMIDAIKLALNLNDSDDVNILKELAKTQFRIIKTIMPLYESALAKKQKAETKRSRATWEN